MSADDRPSMQSSPARRPWSYWTLLCILFPLCLIAHILLRVASSAAIDDGCRSPRERQEWALFQAVQQNDAKTIPQLLAKGVNPNARLADGSTPLHVATSTANADAAKALLAHGADVNAVDKEDKTPLLIACESYAPQMIVVLVDRGADVNVQDKRGNTPLSHIMATSDDLVRRNRLALKVIRAGADVNVRNGVILRNAISVQDVAAAQFLVQHGASMTLKDQDGYTPADLALDSGNPALIALARAGRLR